MSIAGPHSPRAGKDEWLSPPDIVQALGPFDLDPCAPIVRPWDTAARHYTIEDNGLVQPWAGRVWCNPPYGTHTGDWLLKCADHGNALALIFARTDTEDWQRIVFRRARAILFIEGRLFFHHVSGAQARFNSGGPSALIAWDDYNAQRLEGSGLKGTFIPLLESARPPR